MIIKWDDLQVGDRVKFTEEYVHQVLIHSIHSEKLRDELTRHFDSKTYKIIEFRIDERDGCIYLRLSKFDDQFCISSDGRWWDCPGEPVLFEIVRLADDNEVE